MAGRKSEQSPSVGEHTSPDTAGKRQKDFECVAVSGVAAEKRKPGEEILPLCERMARRMGCDGGTALQQCLDEAEIEPVELRSVFQIQRKSVDPRGVRGATDGKEMRGGIVKDPIDQSPKFFFEADPINCKPNLEFHVRRRGQT